MPAQVPIRTRLMPRAQAALPAGSRDRLPTFFDAQEAAEGEDEGNGSGMPEGTTAGSRPGSAVTAAPRLYFPPASAGHNNYTLLK